MILDNLVFGCSTMKFKEYIKSWNQRFLFCGEFSKFMIFPSLSPEYSIFEPHIFNNQTPIEISKTSDFKMNNVMTAKFKMSKQRLNEK